jgi:hypothetical protein
MNIAILLSIISFILLLFLINFSFLGNIYANMIQSSNNDIYLASTNDIFTETESRIPSSVLDDEEETSIMTNNETAQEAETLQSQASDIENVIKTKYENQSSSFNIANSNMSSKVN